MLGDREPQLIPCDGLIVGETEAAVRIQVSIWIPKAAIDFIQYADGRRSTETIVGRFIEKLSIPWKLARAKGLIDDYRQPEPPDNPSAYRRPSHLEDKRRRG